MFTSLLRANTKQQSITKQYNLFQVHLTMQPLILTGLSVILLLPSYSIAKPWEVHVEKNISTRRGSPVTIDCKFEYPPEQKTNNVTIYWKTEGSSSCSTTSNDNNAFIFHPDETCVISQYKGKTKLIGDKTKGNCSLQIQKLMDTSLKIYLRVVGFNDCFSFREDPIYISENGVDPVTDKPDLQAIMTTLEPMSSPTTNGTFSLYLVIFIPLAALLIIALTGVTVYAKHKRSQTFTREESGYYMNFSRASSNLPKSETCNTLDVQHPEPKIIDEPVYINAQESTTPTSQSMDHTDNVYANVDYLK
ncbi:uncharacterized protein LOC121642484 [Melanotaenia boesemani]|uniref:uncharacterized protein LOC121642484 n=1 Tax=Melanotaenia boesemani TaxID=1250792 RepID=UPI001C056272|nr:uncharacterized protein LOC121642484 [Melanotaenia boesemani]